MSYCRPWCLAEVDEEKRKLRAENAALKKRIRLARRMNDRLLDSVLTRREAWARLDDLLDLRKPLPRGRR